MLLFFATCLYIFRINFYEDILNLYLFICQDSQKSNDGVLASEWGNITILSKVD